MLTSRNSSIDSCHSPDRNGEIRVPSATMTVRHCHIYAGSLPKYPLSSAESGRRGRLVGQSFTIKNHFLSVRICLKTSLTKDTRSGRCGHGIIVREVSNQTLPMGLKISMRVKTWVSVDIYHLRPPILGFQNSRGQHPGLLQSSSACCT